MDNEEKKSVVREGYDKSAKEGEGFSIPLKKEECSLSSSLRAVGLHHVLNYLAGESTESTSCCDSASFADEISKMMDGYTEQDSKRKK